MSSRLLTRWLVIAILIAIPVMIYAAPEAAGILFGFIGFFAPLWLPALLIYFGWPVWLAFVRSHFISSVPYTTIELKPGAETPRTARPMELVFYALYHRTNITPVEEYLLGHVRVPWAFEILAHANSVRFFVHLPTAHRQAVEARIRAEYRDIDIDQVRDYSREIPFDHYAHKLSALEFTLGKADPYPLKTYAAHEAERAKRDVFGELLEELAQVGDNEHLLLSFVVRSHQRERALPWKPLHDSLHEDAHHEIVHLLGKAGDIAAVPEKTRATISAIEVALKKPSFDCGVRALYIAEREHFSEERSARLPQLLDRFNDAELNGFVPYSPSERIGWPLSDIFNAVPALKDAYLLQLYRRRAFFNPPYRGKAFVLNTEELATVFHMPHFARASALANIRGIRLEPPENLPV